MKYEIFFKIITIHEIYFVQIYMTRSVGGTEDS